MATAGFLETQGPQVALRKVKSLHRVLLFVTPWTVAFQAAPSMGFFRQQYWMALPFPSPGDLPYPGIKPWSPTLQADALTSEPPGKPNGDSSFHLMYTDLVRVNCIILLYFLFLLNSCLILDILRVQFLPLLNIYLYMYNR